MSSNPIGSQPFDHRSPLIKAVQLAGGEGYVNFEYHTAAVITRWRVSKAPGGRWTLTATVKRADGWLLAQKGARLGFNAPRIGGYWHWPLVSVQLAGGTLTATLGPPVH